MQYWWNPDFGGGALMEAAGVLTFVLTLILVLASLGDRGTAERLGLPPWREFRKDWRLRRR